MLEIYGTLGPACSSADLLEQMLAMGMTGVRLNLSHVTLVQAADQVEALHTAAQRLGVKPKLLIDMQGPELRIGPMSHDVHMIEGKNILLHQPGGIPLPEVILQHITPGQELWMDDGKIRVEVFEARGGLRGQGGALLVYHPGSQKTGQPGPEGQRLGPPERCVRRPRRLCGHPGGAVGPPHPGCGGQRGHQHPHPAGGGEHIYRGRESDSGPGLRAGAGGPLPHRRALPGRRAAHR